MSAVEINDYQYESDVKYSNNDINSGKHSAMREEFEALVAENESWQMKTYRAA